MLARNRSVRFGSEADTQAACPLSARSGHSQVGTSVTDNRGPSSSSTMVGLGGKTELLPAIRTAEVTENDVVERAAQQTGEWSSKPCFSFVGRDFGECAGRNLGANHRYG